jgi:hypothetical protein
MLVRVAEAAGTRILPHARCPQYASFLQTKMENKMRIAIIAACASVLALAQLVPTQATYTGASESKSALRIAYGGAGAKNAKAPNDDQAVRDSANNNVISFVRNPEPFNDPKVPAAKSKAGPGKQKAECVRRSRSGKNNNPSTTPNAPLDCRPS